MRKQILLVILLFINILARSQDTVYRNQNTSVVIDTAHPSTQLVDDSPVGLGISIEYLQDFGEQQRRLISPPTIINVKKLKEYFTLRLM